MAEKIQIFQATMDDLNDLSELFNCYRQFYKQASDMETSKTFLSQRIKNNESIIFVAKNDSEDVVGFTQLYPSFCSVLAKPIFVLYDLFVAETARRSGAANYLMEYAEIYAKERGAAELQLATAKNNYSAQALYEKRGWKRDEDFYHYSKSL